MSQTYDIRINGTLLRANDYAVDSFEGRRVVPARKASTFSPPGRDGELEFVGGREPHSFSISVWVVGDTAQAFEDNMSTVLATVQDGAGILFEWQRPDGAWLKATVRLLAAAIPEIDHVSRFARIKMIFSNKNTFWSGPDVAVSPIAFPSIPVTNPSTAPVKDVSLTVVGPATGIKFTAGAHAIEAGVNIIADQTWRYDGRTGKAWVEGINGGPASRHLKVTGASIGGQFTIPPLTPITCTAGSTTATSRWGYTFSESHT